MQQKWVVKNKKADFDAICKEQNITEVTARLLVNRGLLTKEERDAFLHPSLLALIKPELLRNADAAADMLAEDITAGRKIRIIGDYDVDGIVAVYLLFRTLCMAGAKVDYRIPDRIRDGYGMNAEMVEESLRDGIQTILTCDNGIAATEPIRRATEAGIRVVLTDHHEVPVEETSDGVRQVLPPADVIVNPKQDGETTPFPNICGAYVAYKVMCCLAKKMGIPDTFMQGLLPYVAMATVCDVMELRGENRAVVALGLEGMKNCKDNGICALIEENQLNKENLSGYHFGFVLGPCLNASGRLDTAEKGLALLLAENPAVAATLAKEVTQLNAVRKDMTMRYVRECREYFLTQERLEPVLVAYLPECHESLAGIIAGRIREQFYRPAIVLTDAEDGCKGSGRSIDGYHMYEALCECKDLLTKFGGHPKAAGLSLPRENVELFRKRLVEQCRLTEEELTEKISIDIVLPFGLVTEQVIDELSLLEPFGTGNEKPLFAERNLKVKKAMVLGKNANVLKLFVENEYGRQFETMYFGDIVAFDESVTAAFGKSELDKMYQGRENKVCFSMIYYPDKNEFRGNVTLQAVMRDYKMAVL